MMGDTKAKIIAQVKENNAKNKDARSAAWSAWSAASDAGIAASAAREGIYRLIHEYILNIKGVVK